MPAITAISIGSQVPQGNFDGTVSTVFDRTCNIRLACDRILTLATAEQFDMPAGIRIKSAPGFRFVEAVSGNASVHCRAGVLRLSDSAIRIDLRHAGVWRGECVRAADPPPALLRALWREAVTEERSNALSIEPFFGDRLLAPAQDDKAVAAMVGWLIGRGTGLTPAGDDALAGFLAAPMLLRPNHPASRALVRHTNQCLHLTNEISRQMLRDAMRGLFIEPVITLLSALHGAASLDDAVDDLCAVGGSSGRAMLLGVLAGVAFVNGVHLDSGADGTGSVSGKPPC
jgi:hypothetical protein